MVLFLNSEEVRSSSREFLKSKSMECRVLLFLRHLDNFQYYSMLRCRYQMDHHFIWRVQWYGAALTTAIIQVVNRTIFQEVPYDGNWDGLLWRMRGIFLFQH
ncbi:hypothetical protein CEXT_303821 [Caerostris extrusa]|uniref:Uncharacterized protein n=1 Tax=Caerostris extrusa TaxID=172846 RepID=A0AAV4MQ81_CAEEX|nr:hypothetical protein CEXT_303821 [Caerostris extrusa]